MLTWVAVDELETVAYLRAENGNQTNPTILASDNVASFVRNSTGNYTLTFTNALADTNYFMTSTQNVGAFRSWVESVSTTNVGIGTGNLSSWADFTTYFFVEIKGKLANPTHWKYKRTA